MAASDARLKWSDDVYGVSSEDARIFRTIFRQVYTVLLEKTDDTRLANSATGIPEIGSAHATNSWLRVTNVQSRRVSPVMAEVSVDYVAPNNGDEGNDPTTQAAKVHGSHQDAEVSFDRAADGTWVATPTGEPYRGHTTVKADTVITITRPLATWSENRSVDYANKVNDDTFRDNEPGTVLCKGFDWEEMPLDGGSSYFMVTGRFIIREPDEGRPATETWYKRIMRQGLYRFDGIFTDRVVPILDHLGRPVTVPKVLNINGEPEEDTEATDIWEYFQEFGTATFADIGYF